MSERRQWSEDRTCGEDEQRRRILNTPSSAIETQRSELASMATCSHCFPHRSRPYGQADFWALGVTLFEMLTGQRPFTGESQMVLAKAIVSGKPKDIKDLRPDLSEDLAQEVAKCLRIESAAKESVQAPDEVVRRVGKRAILLLLCLLAITLVVQMWALRPNGTVTLGVRRAKDNRTRVVISTTAIDFRDCTIKIDYTQQKLTNCRIQNCKVEIPVDGILTLEECNIAGVVFYCNEGVQLILKHSTLRNCTLSSHFTAAVTEIGCEIDPNTEAELSRLDKR